MKGLLLKDFYQVKAYCKSYLLMLVGFMGLSIFSKEGFGFTVIYPSLLCSMIPINLISYDTASRWEAMCLTLPYTRRQVVSGKYGVGLLLQLVVLALTAVTQSVKMVLGGGFDPVALLSFVAALGGISLLVPSFMLPLIFKVGVEKGRLLYMVFIGMTFALAAIVSSGTTTAQVPMMGLKLSQAAGLLAAVAVLYVISWALSIRFYSRREF